MNVNIKRLHEDAVIPKYAHDGDSGFDLVAIEDVIIEPGETALVKTGLAFELPDGYEIQIRPRSGITLKTKLRVQLGTVDSHYRGEVGVIVDNLAQNTAKRRGVDVDINYPLVHIDGTPSKLCVFNNNAIYKIRKGDRICQAVIAPVIRANIQEVHELNKTERGDSGFGSSGTGN